jgi:hypothetical protein
VSRIPILSHLKKKLSEEEKLENKMLHIAQASALRR